jgi:hypothetical protein
MDCPRRPRPARSPAIRARVPRPARFARVAPAHMPACVPASRVMRALTRPCAPAHVPVRACVRVARASCLRALASCVRVCSRHVRVMPARRLRASCACVRSGACVRRWRARVPACATSAGRLWGSAAGSAERSHQDQQPSWSIREFQRWSGYFMEGM